jgi:hypothetical protein
MTSKVLAVILCLVAVPAFAQGDLTIAPVHLSLQIVGDKPRERCVRSDRSDPAPLEAVSLHRTFHDDIDEHPLLDGRWVPHYAGPGLDGGRTRDRTLDLSRVKGVAESVNDLKYRVAV